MLTTNSYAAVPKALTLAGAGDWDSIKKVIVASSKVAREAAEKGEGVKVAGALPPLGPSYRFDLVGDESELEEGYKMIAAAVAPGSDLLLCETMSCVREGLAAAKAADEAGLPIWVAYTLNEDGEFLSILHLFFFAREELISLTSPHLTSPLTSHTFPA